MNRALSKSAIRKFEWAINITLGLVVVLFVVTIAQKLFSSSELKKAQPVQIGMKLNLPGVEWAKNEQTLVMALSTNCRFCTESAPMYRRLASELGNNGETRVIAVLPQTVNEGRQYLNDLEVSANEVFQANLEAAGLVATPTLIIVKSDGTITDLWTGKLNIADQFALFNRLHIKNDELATENSGPTIIDALTLKRALDKNAHVMIVDVEEREAYKWRHISGAVNIPVDELEARANDELSSTDTIVVYCKNEGVSNRAAEILMENSGFRLVSVLKGGMAEWEKAGFPTDKLEASAPKAQ